jgi:hypothetical protein
MVMITGLNALAAEYSDKVIQDTAVALERQDFARFSPYFSLPYTISVGQERIVISTTDELLQTFNSVCELYRGQGMNRVHREMTMALFDGPETIHMTHITTLFRDHVPVRAPFSSYVTLKKGAAHWQAVSTHYTADHRATPADLHMTEDSRKEEMEAIRGNALFALFQKSLNQFTQVMQSGSEDEVMETIQFPFFVQGCDDTIVVDSKEDLPKILAPYRTGLTMRGVTDIVRLVKQADLVGDRRISGMFRTHVLAGAQLLMPAYDSTLTLEQSEDLHWRLTSYMMPYNTSLRDSPTARI